MFGDLKIFFALHPALFISSLWFPVALTHNIVARAPRHQTYQIYFAYFLLFNLGLAPLYMAYLHLFNGDFAASLAGLAPSLFQKELGFACMGIGILGMISLQASWAFRSASLIFYHIFYWGLIIEAIYQRFEIHHAINTELWIFICLYGSLPLLGYLLLALTRERRIFR